jgi:hypothetical protein
MCGRLCERRVHTVPDAVQSRLKPWIEPDAALNARNDDTLRGGTLADANCCFWGKTHYDAPI